MTTIRVVWARRMPIGAARGEEVRTLIQDFGSAKKAAEFAADVLYLLDTSGTVTASTEKFYVVSAATPRVEWMSNTRDEWLTVERMPAPVVRRG